MGVWRGPSHLFREHKLEVVRVAMPSHTDFYFQVELQQSVFEHAYGVLDHQP